MDARRLRTALALANGAGIVMLLRSVAFDRWISVFAAVAMLLGVAAARRDKTWGIGLAFAAAAAFPTFVLLGIAPPWFVLIGLLGMLPFVVASRAFARFDKGATVLLGTIGASLGALLAFGWKVAAPMLFDTFPLLRPSYYAQHGLLLAALTGAAVAATLARARASKAGADAGSLSTARVRIGERVRVASANEAELAYTDEVGLEEEVEPRFARPLSQPNTNASATSRDTSSQPARRDHDSRG